MKRILIAGLGSVSLAAFGLVSAAGAADLPVRTAPPTMAAPVLAPSLYNWTGFYVGANAGYIWTRGSGRMRAGGVTGPLRGSGDGWLGGVQAGYNWQSGNIVFGVETDIQAMGLDGTVRGTAGATTLQARVESPWGGTIRARVGYAMDNWLIYVTGGAAYTHTKLRGTRTTGGVATAVSSSATGWTYTVGAGVEAGLWDNWTVKGEYLYAGEPHKIPTVPGISATGTSNTHLVRVGLNYRF